MPRELAHVVEFGSESALRSPARFLRDLAADWAAARQVAWHLFLRDIRAKYRESFLGFVWAVVPAIVVALSFTAAGRANVLQISGVGIPYPAYVVIGMVLWQAFQDGLTGPNAALLSYRPVLTRIRLPIEALHASKAGEVAFNLLIKLPLVGGVMLWYGISPGPEAWLAPLGILGLIALGYCIGLFLSPLTMLFDDASRGLIAVAAYWLFLTPVVYPVPAPGSFFATVVRANPVTPLLGFSRDAITGGAPVEVGAILPLLALSLLGTLLALIVNRVAMPILIERSGA